MPGDDVLAGIDTEIAQAWAHAAQLSTPHPFSRAHVQHGPKLAPEEVFGHRRHHPYLTPYGIRGMNAGTGIAIPSREIRFVVGLTAGQLRHFRRGSHADRSSRAECGGGAHVGGTA